jgi:GNAT superfamily N-acetyltransferase
VFAAGDSGSSVAYSDIVDIRTRAATAGDAAGIALLLRQLGYPTTEAEAKARLEYWSADQRSSVIAADLDGVLAGVAAVHAIPLLEHKGWRGRLVALVVAEARRGRGVGRALVTAAESAAEVLGCREMEITSARDRAAAHSLYESAGYADVCYRAARYLKPLAPSG